MGEAKRKTHLVDYDFKMAESNLCKTRGKEKESFRVFFSEGKVHHLVLKDKILCPHSSCEKDPQFFEKNGITQHFRVVHKCTFVDVNLQESLALRRRLHAKETIDILNEFLSRSEKVTKDKFLCLCDIISPRNNATGTVHSSNPEIGVLWTEIESYLRGVSFFSFTLPSVLCVHAKRSHGPLRDTP